MKKHLFLLLFIFSLTFSQQVLSQTATRTINYTGFQACGGCTVCGSDYWCFNTASSYCGNTAACGTQTFLDPCPPGNIVTSVTVNYYSGGCQGSSMTASINGNAVPTVNDANTGCLCSNAPCTQSATSSANFPCGLPGYVNGGNNTLQMCTGIAVCINRVVLVFSYAPANQATPATTPSAPSGPTSVCAGTAYTYTVPAVNASTYTWTFPPGWVINSGQGTTSVTATPGTAGNICVTASNLCGSSAPSCLAVGISTPSTAPLSASASPNPICPSTPTTLSVSGGSLGVGANWEWYSGSCGGALAGTGSSIVVSPSGTTTYFVRAVGTCNTTGCVSTTVNVNTVATPPGAPSGNTSVCNGDTQPYSTSGSAGATSYNWTVPAGAVINSGQGTSSISVTFGSTSGSICVTASGPCGTSTASCTTVNLNAPQVASFSYPSSPYCQNGSNPSPALSGSAGTFTSSPGGLSMNGAGTVNLAASTPGTYTVTNSIAASGGCPAVSASSNITITALPVGTFSYTGSPYCQNEPNPSPVYSGGGTAGTFTCSPSGLTVDPVTGSADLVSCTPGSYTVTNTFTAAGGCPAVTATSGIIIDPVQTAGFSYSAASYCQSATDPSPTITGTPGGTFSSSPGGLTFVSTATGEVDLSASLLNTYTITYTSPGPCAASSTFNFTISNSPVATFSYTGNATSFCKSDPNPVPTGNAGVFTSTPSGLSFVSTSTGEINLAGSASGTYTVYNTLSGGGCATSIDSLIITINENPVITNTSNSQSICVSGTASFTPTSSVAGTTFTWTASASSAGVTGFSPSGTGNISDLLTNSGTTVDSVTYVITAVGPAPASCTGTGTFTFTAVIYPDPDITNASNTQNICSGNQATFTPSSSVAGTIYNWTATSSAGTITGFSASGTGNISEIINNSGTASGTVTYVITPVGPSGCTGSTTFSFTVTCDPDPLITNTGNTQTICSSGAVSFSPSSAVSGTTFSWTSSASSANVTGNTLNGTGNISDALVNSGTTSETVTYIISSAGPAPSLCAGSSNYTLVVTVDPVPVITNTSGTQTICSGNTASFTPSSNVPGTTFNWTASASSPSITGFSASGSGNISEILSNAGSSAGTVTYVITPVGPAPSLCAASSPFNFLVTVNPLPVADSSSMVITSADCGTSTGSVTGLTMVSGTAPFSYVWTDTLGNTVGTNLDLTNVSAGNYILTITDSNSCSNQFGGSNGINISQTLNVVASFTANPAAGETPLSVSFTNSSTGATNYSWAFGTGDFSTAVNPTYVYIPLGNFTVCLVADNGSGCSDTACSTIDVYLNSVFVIPNVFTPNGDNVNDVFAVQAAGLSSMDAEVFNRWGQKEYEWHTTNGGWDGRTASGIVAPDGTYFFIIKAKGIDGKEYFEKGSFTLMR